MGIVVANWGKNYAKKPNQARAGGISRQAAKAQFTSRQGAILSLKN
jgi:hypothetical protein